MKLVNLFLSLAAEQHEAKRLEEEFMSSVRLGQVEKVDQMVSLLVLPRKVKRYCTYIFENLKATM